MKSFARLTNSYVMTATLLAVIAGSLCFSAGEGLRLRPFPNLALSQIEDSRKPNDAGESSSLSKYGPLDVPTQQQKRGKRHALELASGTQVHARPDFTLIVHVLRYEAAHVHTLPFIGANSGRAPPFNT